MKRLLPVTLALFALLPFAPATHALTPKPNVAPVVNQPVAPFQQYRGTTRVIDLAQTFRDPDASAAVRLTTSLGVMNFTLDGQQTPATVANFLNYVTSGRYFIPDATTGMQASLFFHRSSYNGLTPFVIQSGGYLGTVNPNPPPDNVGAISPTQVPTFPPVANEPFISNKRGTVAMAKLGSDPNSATSQWFINMSDNSANLDVQNSGFTVFGRVAGNGMMVADAISALQRYNGGGAFSELPVLRDTALRVPRLDDIVSIPGFIQIAPLTLAASSSNGAVATVSLSGTNLLVKTFGLGQAMITVSATDLDGVAVSHNFTVNVIPAPARLRNVSTRVKFANGNDVLIAGFIVRGGTSKSLAARAIGPSLVNFGIPNPISDPTLELHAGAPVLAANDNWMDAPNKMLIRDLGLAPSNNLESALITSIPSDPNANTNYTAVVGSGAHNAGVGLVEVYDLDSAPGSTILNLSLRGQVGTGDDVMIGGFIIAGDGTRRLVVRALGPSLTAFGVMGALPDPTIELRNAQGTLVTANDDWGNNPQAGEIQSYGLQPGHPKEAAVIATLPQGRYTAKVSGLGSQPTGVGLIEIYQVQ
ncbi:MAG: peptidylprolyl isomerase [Chthoniobacterales bacterium]